jgi:hypothetical protein
VFSFVMIGAVAGRGVRGEEGDMRDLRVLKVRALVTTL